MPAASLIRRHEPAAKLLVDRRMVEHVEVGQATDMTAPVDLERDPAPAPAARRAGEPDEQVAEHVAQRIVCAASNGGADEVVGRGIEERHLPAAVGEERSRPLSEMWRPGAVERRQSDGGQGRTVERLAVGPRLREQPCGAGRRPEAGTHRAWTVAAAPSWTMRAGSPSGPRAPNTGRAIASCISLPTPARPPTASPASSPSAWISSRRIRWCAILHPGDDGASRE